MSEITLEQVERLRTIAPISFADAKAALEAAGGNLLDAVIDLERQGKVPAKSGGFYSTRGGAPAPLPPAKVRVPRKNKDGKNASDVFKELLDAAWGVVTHNEVTDKVLRTVDDVKRQISDELKK
ncbi:MAG: hypothetical protein RSC08_05295 [Oscillospiraceae bacterium]